MLIKSVLLGAALVSTPLCFLDHQDPGSRQEPKLAEGSTATSVQDPAPATTRRVQDELDAAQRELERAQRKLDEAERRMQDMRRQLDSALDRLDELFEPQRERNCSPSRSRALMSHYQWLRDEGHGQRAKSTLDTLVDQVGDDVRRLNSVAWDLMTDKDTAGRFDEYALALAERMERQGGNRLDHRYLDTIALARFLNGDVDRAVALQQRAIERGGSNDDYRRRLRTYQAAQAAIAKAGGASNGAEVAAGAGSKDDED